MRYERQMIMDEIGKEGQEKLRQAQVTVIGAGGLGSPVLTYLACAGVGKIRIVDMDVVSESNLNRQFLHHTDGIGKDKTVSARDSLLQMNPDPVYEIRNVSVKEDNIGEIIDGSQVVVDCVDNITTREIVHHGCASRKIPLVEGGIQGFYGYVVCIDEHTDCSWLELGDNPKGKIPVLGATAGVIGTLQATQTIKLLLGIPVVFGSIFQYDGIRMTLEEIGG